MYLSEKEYLAYLKARSQRRALQEADLISPSEGATAEQTAFAPPFRLGFLTFAPVWTADDLRAFENLAEGGEWDEKLAKNSD